jgi:Ca2+-transporting ATPase
VLYVPFLQALFDITALHPIDLVICLAGGLLSILWFELLKRIRGRALLASTGETAGS